MSQSYLDARRRQIMDAAITCFAREGFHHATMQDIVAETGLSAGAIYRYFPSKEDIVAAIAAEHHAAEAAALAEAGGDDIAAALRHLVEVSLGRLADPAEQRWRRVTVQVWGEALRSDRVMDIVRGGLDEPVRILADLFRRGQHEGTVPPALDPDGAARVCASIFQGLVLQQAWDPRLDVDAYITAVLALIDALIRPGPAQPGRSGA
ncbi:MAG TPA: TetR/AcrR family transcriptional regulator [Streptosporangiaceae bacterium]|nr:TetR/AcrR family transcriptional regulator [Streptosporangiaceae bacterium]